MQTIFHYLSLIPADVWYTLLAGTLVPLVMQLLKKWFGLDSTKVISGFTTALAFLSAVLPQVISATSANPALLGPQTAAIYGIATLLYIHVVKPLGNFNANYKAFKASQPATTVTPAVADTAPVAPIATPVVAPEPVVEPTLPPAAF